MTPSQTAMLWPGFALAGLTFVVMAEMYRRRFRQMRRERIAPDAVATSVQSAERLTDSAASDNFRNLLELPVLFYVALLLAHATDQAAADVLVLAWLFVALRVVHSAVQCMGNRVVPRFIAFICGALVLLLLWARLALGVFAHV
ncbi:MAPEG family protein [Luteimonas sp. WGS1318]|uniref:MAPEG family protein n=1 Tax=Luteimonas sp. WGS1318 TaxID=3366815 RepID=UPI00372CF337